FALLRRLQRPPLPIFSLCSSPAHPDPPSFPTRRSSDLHFSGVFVALAAGFILLWLYGQPWFMDFSVGGTNMRDLFQMHSINLSIAVWVGFIALFGLATSDGVLMGTYIHDTFV